MTKKNPVSPTAGAEANKNVVPKQQPTPSSKNVVPKQQINPNMKNATPVKAPQSAKNVIPRQQVNPAAKNAVPQQQINHAAKNVVPQQQANHAHAVQAANNVNQNKQVAISPEEARQKSRLLFQNKIKGYDSGLSNKKTNHFQPLAGLAPKGYKM